MIMKMYSFKNRINNTMSSIFLFGSDEQAVRAFCLYLYDDDLQRFTVKCDDLDLIYLGVFDTSDGILHTFCQTIMTGKFVHANALDRVVNDQIVEPNVLLEMYDFAEDMEVNEDE